MHGSRKKQWYILFTKTQLQVPAEQIARSLSGKKKGFQNKSSERGGLSATARRWRRRQDLPIKSCPPFYEVAINEKLPLVAGRQRRRGWVGEVVSSFDVVLQIRFLLFRPLLFRPISYHSKRMVGAIVDERTPCDTLGVKTRGSVGAGKPVGDDARPVVPVPTGVARPDPTLRWLA